MAEIGAFQILDAFTHTHILCSMMVGPDGQNDSTGRSYGLHIAPDERTFLAELVEEAREYHGGKSVVIEWQQMPQSGEDGHIAGRYTMREQVAQGKVATR